MVVIVVVVLVCVSLSVVGLAGQLGKGGEPGVGSLVSPACSCCRFGDGVPQLANESVHEHGILIWNRASPSPSSLPSIS